MSRSPLLHIIILAVIVGLASCHNGGSKRQDGIDSRLDTLLLKRDEGTRAIIDSGIAHSADSMTRYEYTARLARYYYLSPTPDSLVPVLDRVDSFAQRHLGEERGRHLLAYSYNIRGAYYHAFHLEQDRQKALYSKAYDLLMTSKDKSEAPKIAANLADAYAADNELPKAAEWYRRALFLVDSLRLPDSENATLYMGLASIYQQLGDNSNALENFRKTGRLYSTMSVAMKAYYLNNFGNYYYYNGDYHEALGKFTAMRSLLERHHMQDNFDMYLCKVNLADVYLNLDSLHQAADCLDYVEPYVAKMGDNVMMYYCNTIRIGIAVKQHRWAEVKRLAAQDSSQDAPFTLREIRARYMRGYYEATGDYATAYHDLIANDTFSDSLEHNRSNMRSADIMARFTADTLRLHGNLAIQQQREKARKTETAMMAAVALVVILVLLLLLLVQRSRKKIAETRMKVLDLRLQGARIRISPHFIFNILNNHIITADKHHDDTELIELSKLIRENLNMSRQIAVPLSEELDFVRQYVTVERPLVGDDLDFSVNLQPGIDADTVMVPSMMVQILVENAFVHALRGWQGHKMLHIDVARQPGAVSISVTDNGPGFDATSLFRSASAQGNGLNIIRQTIAVLNSRSRHKIIFNMENIEADGKVKGCRATIVVPDGMLKRVES